MTENNRDRNRKLKHSVESRDAGSRSEEQRIVPFIEGDGIGADVMRATRAVLDAALSEVYSGRRTIVWHEILAGAKAQEMCGSLLPEETLTTIKKYGLAIKGPLSTPVAGGYRSLNVALRQALDLYACIRPVRYFEGIEAPVRHPERLDVVIFRENTEDVYAGIEWQEGSEHARRVIDFLNKEFSSTIRKDSGIGIKPMSRFASRRLVGMALRFALQHNRKSVTLVHKGNIMKYTEGAFRDWGYEVAAEKEFSGKVLDESALYETYNGALPEGKIVLNDRIADNMFQQILLYPEHYDVLATPNLNGDYLSDACAAQVGGLGIAPGANVGDTAALFEATHGTAPDIAGKGIANPTSLILSAVMMLEHLGWNQAAERIENAIRETLRQKKFTRDLAASDMQQHALSTEEFTAAVIENI